VEIKNKEYNKKEVRKSRIFKRRKNSKEWSKDAQYWSLIVVANVEWN